MLETRGRGSARAGTGGSGSHLFRLWWCQLQGDVIMNTRTVTTRASNTHWDKSKYHTHPHPLSLPISSNKGLSLTHLPSCCLVWEVIGWLVSPLGTCVIIHGRCQHSAHVSRVPGTRGSLTSITRCHQHCSLQRCSLRWEQKPPAAKITQPLRLLKRIYGSWNFTWKILYKMHATKCTEFLFIFWFILVWSK